MDSRAHWVSDEAVTNCKGCNLKFDLLNRRHHCRMCGLVYCDKCSDTTVTVNSLDLYSARACRGCHSFVNKSLPVLIRETPFRILDPLEQEFNEVFFQISNNHEQLTWRSNKSTFRMTNRAEMIDFRRVLDGQQTETFKAFHPHPLLTCCMGPGITAMEEQSFSLIFNDQTIDMIANTREEKNVWLTAFRDLAARSVGATADTLRSVRREAEEQAKADRQNDIRSKHKAASDKFKVKYGALT